MIKENENEFELPIWKQTIEGDWKMFFNTETKEENKIVVKEHMNVTFISQNKKTNKLGCLVMTPKGIGTLINLESSLATVKFIKEYTDIIFEETDILFEFPIYIRLLNPEYSNWYKVVVPANGSVGFIKKSIEKLGIVDSTKCDYMLIYQGSEAKEHLTFDQINLKSGDKFLISGLKMIEYKLTRFTSVSDYWYCNPDAIIFSVNKKIKLSGIGIYSSMEGNNQIGTLVISEVEGEYTTVRGRGRRNRRSTLQAVRETIIFEQQASVPASHNRNECITRVNLEKTITIKPFSDYKIEFKSTVGCETYYGNGGKATAQGERDVEFYFKQGSYESNATSGNFPDIYYYA